MFPPTPIIGREALLSLIDWVNTIRRQQDERTLSGDAGTREADSRGAQTADYRAVSTNGSSAADSKPPRQQGGRGEEGV